MLNPMSDFAADRRDPERARARVAMGLPGSPRGQLRTRRPGRPARVPRVAGAGARCHPKREVSECAPLRLSWAATPTVSSARYRANCALHMGRLFEPRSVDKSKGYRMKANGPNRTVQRHGLKLPSKSGQVWPSVAKIGQPDVTKPVKEGHKLPAPANIWRNLAHVGRNWPTLV